MTANIFSEEFIDQLSERIADLVIRNLPKEFNTKEVSDDDLITRHDAAELLDISPVTLYHWTRKGKIKSYSLGRRKYYKKSELVLAVTKEKKEVRYS